eukprot:3882218-Pleurochrysis_carterae.AAC.2
MLHAEHDGQSDEGHGVTLVKLERALRVRAEAFGAAAARRRRPRQWCVEIGFRRRRWVRGHAKHRLGRRLAGWRCRRRRVLSTARCAIGVHWPEGFDGTCAAITNRAAAFPALVALADVPLPRVDNALVIVRPNVLERHVGSVGFVLGLGRFGVSINVALEL